MTGQGVVVLAYFIHFIDTCHPERRSVKCELASNLHCSKLDRTPGRLEVAILSHVDHTPPCSAAN